VKQGEIFVSKESEVVLTFFLSRRLFTRCSQQTNVLNLLRHETTASLSFAWHHTLGIGYKTSSEACTFMVRLIASVVRGSGSPSTAFDPVIGTSTNPFRTFHHTPLPLSQPLVHRACIAPAPRHPLRRPPSLYLVTFNLPKFNFKFGSGRATHASTNQTSNRTHKQRRGRRCQRPSARSFGRVGRSLSTANDHSEPLRHHNSGGESQWRQRHRDAETQRPSRKLRAAGHRHSPTVTVTVTHRPPPTNSSADDVVTVISALFTVGVPDPRCGCVGVKICIV